MEKSIAVFRGKEIRKTIHNNEWWFSVADVVEVLTDSTDPRQYIKKCDDAIRCSIPTGVQFVPPFGWKQKVVSPENYLDIPQKRRKQLNEKE